MTFHDLRRTFVSNALAAGMSPQQIKIFTGHSDVMIGHYNHGTTAQKTLVHETVLEHLGTIPTGSPNSTADLDEPGDRERAPTRLEHVRANALAALLAGDGSASTT